MKLTIEGGQALILIKDAKAVVMTSKVEQKGQGVKAAIVCDISGSTQLTVDEEPAGAYFLNGGLDTAWAKDSLQFIGLLNHTTPSLTKELTKATKPGLGPSPASCVWVLWVARKKDKKPKWRLVSTSLTRAELNVCSWRSKEHILRVMKVEVPLPQ